MSKDAEKLSKGGVSLYMAEWPDKGRIERRWKYQMIGKDESKSVESRKMLPEKKKKENKKKESSETVLVEPEVSVSSPLSGHSVVDVSEKETSPMKKSSVPKWKQQKQARIEEEERREFEEEQKRSKEKSEKGLEKKVDQLSEMVKQLMTTVDELMRQSSGFCLSLHCPDSTKLDEEKKKLFKNNLDDVKKTLDE